MRVDEQVTKKSLKLVIVRFQDAFATLMRAGSDWDAIGAHLEGPWVLLGASRGPLGAS